MTILIIGANGQLGHEMRLVSCTTSDKYIFSDVTEAEGLCTISLDMTDAKAVNDLVDAEQVDVIINCAAYTAVDNAETNPIICHKLNAEAPGILAEAMKRRNGLLIHISTDYVFGGELFNTPIREEQTCSPLGVYGQTKLLGEQKIRTIGCQHVILRTAWLYSEFGKNFVKIMLSLTAERPSLKVVFDQVGTPTYALDLAKTISVILEDYKAEKNRNVMRNISINSYSKGGTYHYSNEGVTSWYDFAKAIAELAGHKNCDIQPCRSEAFPSPVRRPAYSVLDKTKVKDTFGISVPHWKDALNRCFHNLF